MTRRSCATPSGSKSVSRRARRPGGRLLRRQRRPLGRDALALSSRSRGRGGDPGGGRRGTVPPPGRPGHRHGPDAHPAGRPRASSAIGLDLSRQMLNVARDQRLRRRPGGLRAAPRGYPRPSALADEEADLVIAHQVLHYLGEPAAAVAEAARLVAPGGRLLIIDFASHDLEFLRAEHRHRRLGFFDNEIERWASRRGPRQGLRHHPAARRAEAARPSRSGSPSTPMNAYGGSHERPDRYFGPSNQRHGACRPRRRPRAQETEHLVRVLAAEDTRSRGDAVEGDPPARAAETGLYFGDLWRGGVDPRSYTPHRRPCAE